jgi:signal transduction histidine kinase
LAIAAREGGIGSGFGAPIVVNGRLWGLMAAGLGRAVPVPAATEARLASFTELLATAIANAESRSALARLADEQAALRRVATLVAAGAAPQEAFAAVANEAGRLFLVDVANLCRYESDGTFTVVAAGERALVGRRFGLGGNNVTTLVFETGRPARVDYADVSGPVAAAVRERRYRSAVGSPIIVEGHLWGSMGVVTTVEQPLPADTEARLGSFTELVATAVANAENRAALAASRARIVAAADETRRRIERDLHDGAQQRLVHAVIALKLARRAQKTGDANAGELLDEALRQAEQANSELRELAHGILPASLIHSGLRAGVEALVSRVSLPVSAEVPVERLPPGVEATAYFVISEALTNVVKHAHADRASVIARAEHGRLRVEICDDGIGGADPAGSGLLGLNDRVEALGGTLRVTSPAGSGTTLLIQLPVE